MHKGNSRAILNLNEVTAYDKAGKVIAPLSTRMSSESGSFTVDKCHDGKTDGHFCHSNHLGGDKDPYLVFRYRADADISKIIVHNRIGSEIVKQRIVGASIRICTDSGPH